MNPRPIMETFKWDLMMEKRATFKGSLNSMLVLRWTSRTTSQTLMADLRMFKTMMITRTEALHTTRRECRTISVEVDRTGMTL